MKVKLWVSVCILCGCIVSCGRWKTITTPDWIFLYAPNNKVTVNYLKAEYPYRKGKEPVQTIEVFADSAVHKLESAVEHYQERVPDVPVLPEEDYYFHFTASDTIEYYVYSSQWVKINGKTGYILDYCEEYSPEVVFKAIKAQAPDRIHCISSTEEQKIHGDYFNHYNDKPPVITIQ